MKRIALALLLVTTTLHASTTSNAKDAIATLRRAVTNRDAALISRLYGSESFRTADTHRILWDAVERHAAGAEMVMNHTVLTVAEPTTFAIIGWDGDTLRSIRFDWNAEAQAWVVGGWGIDASIKGPGDRLRYERYVASIPESRLKDDLLHGNMPDQVRLKTELERLARSAAPPALLPVVRDVAPTQAYQVINLWSAAWHGGDCKQLSLIYAPNVAVENTFGRYNKETAIKNCMDSPRRLNCQLQHFAATESGTTITVHGDDVCENTGFASSVPKTFIITRSPGGALTITAERDAPQ